jgi:hypothetical protein
VQAKVFLTTEKAALQRNWWIAQTITTKYIKNNAPAAPCSIEAAVFAAGPRLDHTALGDGTAVGL